jgi:hypothetical protein
VVACVSCCCGDCGGPSTCRRPSSADADAIVV